MDDSPIINAFKHMKVPLMIIGPDGAIVHCNCATSQLFGYADNDLMGRSVCDVLPFESVSELNALIEAPEIDAIIKGLNGHNQDGTQVPLAIHITRWTDIKHGQQYAMVLRDINKELATDRLSKDELRRANNAINGARIGVFEYNSITENVIVSNVWRDLMEIGQSDILDVQAVWRERVHPDDLELALEPVRICLDNTKERASCEYRLRSKDALQWRWMRTDISIAKKDATGRVVSLIGAMTEITKRKAIESALQKSEEQFRSAFESAVVGKAVVSLDGKWLRVNPALCDLVGYTQEQLLATDFQSLTHPDDLAEDLFKLDLLKAGKIPAYQMEKRYIRANGAIMWGLLSVGVVKNAEGRADQFISQIIDITEQRRLSELKSEFISTVSHELRTPLTSVLGSLALLSSMDTEPLSDEAQRLLYIAQENGKRLHALINDVLDFEKFSAQQMRFELSVQNIPELIDEAVLTNLGLTDKYGIRFKSNNQDRSLTGLVDPKRFQQIMANLLSNAAKFADNGSQVDVKVTKNAKSIKISVINKGEGIPEEFRDQIFKPFAQATPSTKRARSGTGLGLNITKQIVEQTGGRIGFDSSKIGQTTFWFTVPEANASSR